MPKIIITITASENTIKDAIARGWNREYNEQLTLEDIGCIDNREDIIRAIPFISNNLIKTIIVNRRITMPKRKRKRNKVLEMVEWRKK